MSPIFKHERGYAFRIFSNEEERMHIHVMKNHCEAKVWLEPTIELANNDGFAQHEINQVTSKKTLRTILNLFLKDFVFLWKEHSHAM